MSNVSKTATQTTAGSTGSILSVSHPCMSLKFMPNYPTSSHSATSDPPVYEHSTKKTLATFLFTKFTFTYSSQRRWNSGSVCHKSRACSCHTSPCNCPPPDCISRSNFHSSNHFHSVNRSNRISTSKRHIIVIQGCGLGLNVSVSTLETVSRYTQRLVSVLPRTKSQTSRSWTSTSWSRLDLRTNVSVVGMTSRSRDNLKPEPFNQHLSIIISHHLEQSELILN
jgi:hypothetical protein